MKKSAYCIIILSLILAGCNSKREISLSTNLSGSVWHQNGELIAETMAKYGWQIKVYHGSGYSGDKSRALIENKEIDFAIIPNNRVIDQGDIRAVAPLNQEAMVFLYKDDGTEYNSLKELMQDKTVLMPIQGTGTSGLINEVFTTLEIRPADYSTYNIDLQKFHFLNDSWKNELDSADVIIAFTQLNNPLIKLIVGEGWKLFQLGDINSINQGSLIDALCIKYPWAFPIIIPKKVFGNNQPQPIYTLGIQSLLVTNKNTDSNIVYDFLIDFYTSLPTMSQKNVMFAQINENYNNASISYPLHEGTIRYMDRDKPTLLERNVELIALFVTLFVLATGIINGYLKRLKQTKKDRIDVYYDELLTAKSTDELESVRLKAINQMQAESLIADDSFVIFLQLYQQRKTELE